VFFGSGAFGLPTLTALSRTHDVRAVVTQPDRPAGRGGALAATPIGEWAAAELGAAPLLKPGKVNEASVVSAIRAFEAEAWVVIAFGQKLGRALLDGVFAVNLHASLLPRWRGAAPINAAILAGDAETGNSVITLADRMDAGLVLGQTRRKIAANQTAGELHDLLASDGPELVMSVLEAKQRGTLRGETQDESKVTIAPKLSKADGYVDFTQTAEECRRRVHGLTPWPGVTVQFRGQGLKLIRVETVSLSGEEGVVLDPEGGVVGCGGGSALKILEVLPAGRKQMPWREFARGARVERGERVVGKLTGSQGT